MPQAIENLATNFESFLKKIAYLKFNDSNIFFGDEVFLGIEKCTLFNLIEGIIPSKKEPLDSSKSKNFPSKIVPYTGIEKAILDFVREKIAKCSSLCKKI